MRPKIVYLQTSHPNRSETFVRAEINSLHRRGYDVWVVTKSLVSQIAAECDYRDKIAVLGTDQDPVELVREIAPNYIHSHFVTESVIMGKEVSAALQVPFGFTCHAYDIWKQKHRVEPEELNRLGNNPLCVVCAVEGTRHAEYLRWCGVPQSKIVITPNTISADSVGAFRESLPQRVRNLIMVGRPVAKKGFLVATDAVRLLRLGGHDIHLRLIGPGDLSKPIGAELVTLTKLFPFISVEPMIAHSAAVKAIGMADALLMPSVVAEDGDSDGIPTVLTEAMLLGVPVITTDVGSVTDLVQDGVTGFIARSGDAACLAKKIIDVDDLYRTPERAAELLLRAYNAASAKEIEKSVDALISRLSCIFGEQ